MSKVRFRGYKASPIGGSRSAMPDTRLIRSNLTRTGQGKIAFHKSGGKCFVCDRPFNKYRNATGRIGKSLY